MTQTPTADSIHERVVRAQEETRVVLTIDGRPNILEMDEISPPKSNFAGRRSMDRFMEEAIWQTEGPAFRRLQDWVGAHWNPEEEKLAPSGTIVVAEYPGSRGHVRLDAVDATRKLIAAAKLYGPDQVAAHAAAFAVHGMVEVRKIFLLKGPPVKAAKVLDKYCTLLPYCEARARIDAESDKGDVFFELPEPNAANLCALEARYFELIGHRGNAYSEYTTPLLKQGPEKLALLLGLVWGTGFRAFGQWSAVPAPAAAALPYRHETGTRGGSFARVALALQGFGPQPMKRPLAIEELHNLATQYSRLPERDRRRLGRAIARLRNSMERTDDEDSLIDRGVALEIVFREHGEREDRALLVPARAAWHYADSGEERRLTENMLAKFCDWHSDAEHGHASVEPGTADHIRNAELLADIDNVLRACLKTMIVEGLPEDWKAVGKQSALRHDPPRTKSDIPSMKSDSLSWSVEEQEGIDRALQEVWKPVVETAPLPEKPSPVFAQLAPELVNQYREQGTPYVVVHPARLYMAHPKWPRTGSEPLDEHTVYYCERDVERHVRRWREAATEKGLVQFEVPAAAAELYHPTRRNDWPQPLLSSHEEAPHNRETPQPIAAGERVASPDCDPAADTTVAPHSIAEEVSVAPSTELPASTISEIEKEWIRLWRSFQYDVNAATNSLLHMLDGIHAKHLTEKRRLLQTGHASGGADSALGDASRSRGNICAGPTYPKLRTLPVLIGDLLITRTAPDGPMEQSVFKGWISQVYDLWESHYRTQLKHQSRYLTGAIRPRQHVLGDLRHIRNNLLHNGIAKQGEAASCEILRWFGEGERMHVRLRHVLDFLNQMAWLSENPVVSPEGYGRASIWVTDKEGDVEDPAPALVSVRPLVDPQQEDPAFRYGATMVFENGVFGQIPMGPEREETEAQAKERALKWQKMTVDERGDLCIPDYATVGAAQLYFACLKGEKQPGPGIWSPRVQFSE